MTPLIVGMREDVVGFALAGVGGMICSTSDDVERALTAVGPDQVVVLSAVAAALASERIAEWEKSGRGPLFVVLPMR